MPHLALQRMLLPGVDVKTMNSGKVKSGLGKEALAQGGMDAIATIIVPSGGLDSVIFTSIPQGYKNIHIRYVARTTRTEANDGFSIQVNGDSGANYRYHYLAASGSSMSSYSEGSMTGFQVPYVSAASAGTYNFGAGIVDLLDYSDSTKNKVARIFGGESQGNGGWIALESGLWLNTAAISSIKFQSNSLGDFAENSQFSLYGVK